MLSNRFLNICISHKSISIPICFGLCASFYCPVNSHPDAWGQTSPSPTNGSADYIAHPPDATPVTPADYVAHPPDRTPPVTPPPPVDIPPYVPPWEPSLLFEPPIAPPAPPSLTNPPPPPATKTNPGPNRTAKTGPVPSFPITFPGLQFPLIELDMPPKPRFDWHWWLLWVILGGYVGYRWFLLMQLTMYLQSPPEMSRAEPTVVADGLLMEPYQIYGIESKTFSDHSIPYELPLPISLGDFDFEFSFTSDLSAPTDHN